MGDHVCPPPYSLFVLIAGILSRSREGDVILSKLLSKRGLIPKFGDTKGETIFKQRDKRGGVRLVLTVTGGLLVVAAPIVGLLPGPGGIFVFAVGFTLMLKNSALVRKFYARLKARHPKKGEWVDWAMRRKSALRRSRRRRDNQGTD